MPLSELLSRSVGIGDLAFAVDPTVHEAEGVLSLLGRVAPAFMLSDEDGVISTMSELGLDVSGVISFSDPLLPLACALARELGLPAVSRLGREAALVSKWLQRDALMRAGLSAVTSRRHRPGSTWPVFPGEPVVVKPDNGTASRDAFVVRTLREYTEVVRLLGDRGECFVVEDFIVGAEGTGRLAPYISVESVSRGGRHRALGLMGRLPLGSDLRETGCLFPCLSAPEGWDEAALLGLVSAALDAIGFENGFSHTEVKLSPSGPEVIEINGRVGGDLPGLVRLTSGFSILDAAIEVARGGGCPKALPAAQRVAGLVSLFRDDGGVPDQQLVESLRGAAGVAEVRLVRRAREDVTVASGADSRCVDVVLTGPDEDAVLDLIERVESLWSRGSFE